MGRWMLLLQCYYPAGPPPWGSELDTPQLSYPRKHPQSTDSVTTWHNIVFWLIWLIDWLICHLLILIFSTPGRPIFHSSVFPCSHSFSLDFDRLFYSTFSLCCLICCVLSGSPCLFILYIILHQLRVLNLIACHRLHLWHCHILFNVIRVGL